MAYLQLSSPSGPDWQRWASPRRVRASHRGQVEVVAQMTGSYPSSPSGPSGLGGARYCHLVAVCSQHLSHHTSSGGLGSPHPRSRDWWRAKQMLGMISAPALSASTKCNPGLPGQGEQGPWHPEKWTEAPGFLPPSSSGHLLLWRENKARPSGSSPSLHPGGDPLSSSAVWSQGCTSTT